MAVMAWNQSEEQTATNGVSQSCSVVTQPTLSNMMLLQSSQHWCPGKKEYYWNMRSNGYCVRAHCQPERIKRMSDTKSPFYLLSHLPLKNLPHLQHQLEIKTCC